MVLYLSRGPRARFMAGVAEARKRRGEGCGPCLGGSLRSPPWSCKPPCVEIEGRCRDGSDKMGGGRVFVPRGVAVPASSEVENYPAAFPSSISTYYTWSPWQMPPFDKSMPKCAPPGPILTCMPFPPGSNFPKIFPSGSS